MKVTNSPAVNAVYEVSRTGRAAGATQSGGEAPAHVSISSDAQWISGLRDSAAASEPVREDLVAEVKAQIAAGTFESSVDMDDVLDGLMADL